MNISHEFKTGALPYKIGPQYGIKEIEKLFDDIDLLCSQSKSPLPDDPDINASNIIARFEEIFEQVPAEKARIYFDDIDKSLRRFTNWRGNPSTQINDPLFYLFADLNLQTRSHFASWTSATSVYYNRPGENPETTLHAAKDDLQQAVSDIRGKPMRSEDVQEAWKRGEDALYYILANGLSPVTPEKEWQKYAASAAYLFAIDNMVDNKLKQEQAFASLRRKNPDAPLTELEREKYVKFEGSWPISRGDEIGHYLPFKAQNFSYGREMDNLFDQSIRYFLNVTRNNDDPDLAI